MVPGPVNLSRAGDTIVQSPLRCIAISLQPCIYENAGFSRDEKH